MNRRIHQTITGERYEVKNKGGRHRLPDDVRLSEIVKGWSETLIINLALSEWMDKMNSVQETV